MVSTAVIRIEVGGNSTSPNRDLISNLVGSMAPKSVVFGERPTEVFEIKGAVFTRLADVLITAARIRSRNNESGAKHAKGGSRDLILKYIDAASQERESGFVVETPISYSGHHLVG